VKLLSALLCCVAIAVVAAQDKSTPSANAPAPDETVPREFLGFTDSNSFHGVIDDPDGYVNLRSNSAIVAKVQKGERFTFQRHDYDPWCSVKLASGKTGWMDAQRIMLSFTKEDLPGKSDANEIEESARKHGIDYYETVQGAVRGDVEARKKFFRVSEFADGAGAEEHSGVLSVVIHLIGDDALAEFLRSQPVSFQVGVRNSIEDDVTWPFRATGYLQRHFPKTAKIFFRREITDWPSPDGKYAIHKIFSDEYTDDDSIVTRSELVDKASGKRVLDLKREDHGKGRYKEGDVEWAPDSKGFLFINQARDAADSPTLYFLSGKSFARIDLPHDDGSTLPAEVKMADADYDGFGGENIHWSNPGTLVSEKTYYFKKTSAPDSVQYLQRKFETTMKVGPDGKLTTESKKISEAKPGPY
jgi:hypothetical protein